MKRILSLILAGMVIAPQTMMAIAPTSIKPEPTVSKALYVIGEAGVKSFWGFSESIADTMIAGGNQGMNLILKYSKDTLTQYDAASKAKTMLTATVAAGILYGTYRFILKPMYRGLFKH